ncbi:MAG: ATP-binding protein [Pedococcus sp.]
MSDDGHWLLAPNLRAPREARQLLRDWAAGRGTDGEAAHILALVATELVTNAVVHARGPVGLSVRADPDAVTVLVTDAGEGRLRPHTEHGSAPNGRGLTIVRALALEWGVHRRPGGKTVWARVPIG